MSATSPIYRWWKRCYGNVGSEVKERMAAKNAKVAKVAKITETIANNFVTFALFPTTPPRLFLRRDPPHFAAAIVGDQQRAVG